MCVTELRAGARNRKHFTIWRKIAKRSINAAFEFLKWVGRDNIDPESGHYELNGLRRGRSAVLQ